VSGAKEEDVRGVGSIDGVGVGVVESVELFGFGGVYIVVDRFREVAQSCNFGRGERVRAEAEGGVGIHREGGDQGKGKKAEEWGKSEHCGGGDGG